TFERSREERNRTGKWGELSTTGAACQPQILVGRGVREAFDRIDARLLDPRADAPQKRELEDGHVHHAIVHDLLDLVQQRLALPAIELARLALEEILDLRHDAGRIDAVLRDVDLDARGGVAGGRAEPHDHATQLLLAPRAQERRTLHRAQARADADAL